MKLITVATTPKGYFKYLLESCTRNNSDIIVLDWKKPWKGFNQKFLSLKKYLSELDPNEIVCFIDAYDVILLRPVTELESEFINFEKSHPEKIIVGQDAAISPHCSFVEFFTKLYFQDCNGIPLNSGTILGRVKDMLNMLNTVLTYDNTEDADDQRLLIKYCQQTSQLIYIDVEYRFFHVNYDFSSNIPLQSFIAHAPGHSNMDPLLTRLGYIIQDSDKHKMDSFLFINKYGDYLFLAFVLFLFLCWFLLKKFPSYLGLFYLFFFLFCFFLVRYLLNITRGITR
jgi:hypothetical protein